MNVIDLVWMRRPKILSKRFIEIDLLRGLALMLMIFGHILWDLDYFDIMPMNGIIYSGLQKIVPPLFFLLAGMSIIISIKKKERTPEQEKKYYKHLLTRGLKIFNLGMFLTIGSMIFLSTRPVLFGVLHCIGFSIILSIPFLKYRPYNLLFAIMFILTGFIIGQIHISNPTIFHLALGLHQTDVWRYTVDYFPLLPWFGITLLGISIGDILYNGDKRKFRMPELGACRPAKLFSWIGQHSLEIYLLHQPIIAGALYIFVRGI